MYKNKKICVVVPAYNEQKHIRTVINTIPKFVDKIIVIDDSKVIRMHVKDMLPPGNFEVIEAKNGQEGYELICTENPNLIMLDFLLPKMSGWEVYQELQKDLMKVRTVGWEISPGD